MLKLYYKKLEVLTVTNKPVIEKTLEVKPEQLIIQETNERAFARICQIMTSKGTLVGGAPTSESLTKKYDLRIPFKAYDEIVNVHMKNAVEKQFPDFFDEALLNKITLMRLLEIFTEDEITSADDLLGAVINPMMCMGNALMTSEDDVSNEVIISLTEADK